MTAILLGLALGGFLTLTVYGLNPPRASLTASLARQQATCPAPPLPAPPGATGPEAAGWAARFGRWAVPVLTRCHLPTRGLHRDLAVAEVPAERLLAEKATAFLAGLLAPSSAALLLWGATGSAPSRPLTAFGSLTVAAVLFFVPDLAVRATARQRRAELRHTLSIHLNLVVIALAGGAGMHQALADAAAGPRGWAAAQLRRCLTAAEVGRTNVWQELGNLGASTGVPELEELAATVALAGSEGARTRTSLEAKAAAMRTRSLAACEGAAQSATERMALPLVVLFAGFLVFIGYPALHHVLAGL